jgi:hypothetical protein
MRMPMRLPLFRDRLRRARLEGVSKEGIYVDERRDGWVRFKVPV